MESWHIDVVIVIENQSAEQAPEAYTYTTLNFQVILDYSYSRFWRTAREDHQDDHQNTGW